VVGCADPELSNGAMMERKADDELIVRCPGSRETWYMTCGADNKWIGEVFNCSSSQSDFALCII